MSLPRRYLSMDSLKGPVFDILFFGVYAEISRFILLDFVFYQKVSFEYDRFTKAVAKIISNIYFLLFFP